MKRWINSQVYCLPKNLLRQKYRTRVLIHRAFIIQMSSKSLL